VTRIIHDVDRALVSAEIAYVGDRNEIARLANGVFSTGVGFKPNRLGALGDYARGTLAFEFHPRVNGEGLTPGIAARIAYTIAAGDLNWQRIEAKLSARRYWHGLILAAHLDAGAVVGTSSSPNTL